MTVEEPPFNRGGVVVPWLEWAEVEADDHILHDSDGVWQCVRGDHPRNVCHGNQYDHATMSWRSL